MEQKKMADSCFTVSSKFTTLGKLSTREKKSCSHLAVILKIQGVVGFYNQDTTLGGYRPVGSYVVKS